jgi:hypothetical protein
MRMEAPRS